MDSQHSDTAMPSNSRELWALLAGVVLLAIYAQYLSTHEFVVVFWLRSTLSFVSSDELLLWLAHSLFVVPGTLLVGWGVSEHIARITRAGARRLSRTDRNYRIAGLCYFVLLFALYSVLGAGVMLDLPISDDEIAVQFGAKVWLDGHLMMPSPDPEGAYSNLFTYSREGLITSFDWPGTIGMQAAAQATGLGRMLYALVAALGGLATVAAAHGWLGRRGAMLMALIWVVSPMGLTLSLTTHAHVLSRTSIACAFYFVSLIDTQSANRNLWWAGVGLGTAVGIGSLTRPFEVGFMMTPIGVWILARAILKKPGARVVALGAATGCVPFIALHVAYNWMVTGRGIVPPRFDRANTVANELEAESIVDRIGTHVAHNMMMLAMFALGPLATLLAGLAPLVSPKRRPVALLSLSVVSVLGLALAHDNIGIHSVGPIHYSEAFVPLGLLFVFFVFAVHKQITSIVWRTRLLAVVASYFCIALPLSSLQQLRALGAQAEMTNIPIVALERQNIHNAIVVVPPRALLYRKGTPGSWVLDYPPPHPTNDWIFVRPTADLAGVRAQYPGRGVWKLSVESDGNESYLLFVPVE